jgi:hypothetical protein
VLFDKVDEFIAMFSKLGDIPLQSLHLMGREIFNEANQVLVDHHLAII